MSRFNQDEYNAFVINNVLHFDLESITLSSGRQTHWYGDFRSIGDPLRLNLLAEYIIAFTEDLGLKPDCFYGVKEGATTIATITQFRYAMNSLSLSLKTLPIPMGRGKSKAYGLPGGGDFIRKPIGKTIIIEDAVETGGSLLEEIDRIRCLDGVEIIAAFSLMDRMTRREDRLSVREVVESRGFPYHALSNAFDLLPRVHKELDLGEDLKTLIEEEYDERGILPLVI